ncbi:MAG: hypothetical protein KGL01_01890, partial [Betaproteobacteria bacterium]|nr:hypothetical protein [Betaproteobacteria bacterium]
PKELFLDAEQFFIRAKGFARVDIVATPSVAPAQAGAQSIEPLDSRLRGITSDLSACGLSRMASSSINDEAGKI